MKFQKLLFSLTLAFLVASNCMAQDETKTANPKAKKATARAVKSTTEQMMKAFDPAKLTAEQKEKAKAIIEKLVPAVVEARNAQNSLLTDEQKAKRKEAFAKAKESGAKGRNAGASLKAMGLSDDELKKYNAAAKKVTDANGKIKTAIMALLTDEQKASMPAPRGKKGKGKKKNKAAGADKN